MQLQENKMDDLIVIILTLAIAAISLLGRVKKKPAEQDAGNQNKVPRENQGGNFWDFLEEETKPYTEQAAKIEEEHTEYETVQEVMAKKEPIEKEVSQYHFKPQNEGMPVFKENLTRKVKKKTIRKMQNGKSFSLRDAVIYSEILNRKYN